MDYKIFFDTNCILDFLLDRNENSDIVSIIMHSKNYPFIHLSAISIVNIHYIAKIKELKEFEEFVNKFLIVDLTKDLIDHAFKLEIKDFEDGIQLVSAIQAKCNYLVTSNKKDFKNVNGLIDIVTPKELLKLLEK